MNIKIITVGKIKEKYLRMAIDEYSKRLGAYCRLEIIEVKDEKIEERFSDAEKARAVALEHGGGLELFNADGACAVLTVRL